MKLELQGSSIFTALSSRQVTYCKRSKVFAAGSNNAIVLIRISEESTCRRVVVRSSFCFHQDKVTCLSFVPKCLQQEGSWLVSGSVDKTISVSFLTSSLNLTLASRLVGHTGALTAVCGHPDPKTGDLLVASSSSDSTVRIWKVPTDKHENNSADSVKVIDDLTLEHSLLSTLSFSRGFVLSMCVNELPSSDVVFFGFGTDDSSVHLYCYDSEKSDIEHVHNLTGHTDWVRCLSCCSLSGVVKVASGSQDGHVRLWQISPQYGNSARRTINQKQTSNSSQECHIHVAAPLRTFSFKATSYVVETEAVLSGHTNWITSVDWTSHSAELGDELTLLSSSTDGSSIIWKYEPDSEIWLETLRFDEASGETSGGTFDAKFASDSREILSVSFTGAAIVWQLNDDGDQYFPSISISGHHGPVEDLCWSPGGEYLLTCSSDQTTRLYGCWVKDNQWYELGRPQVHGYDISTVCSLGPFRFVSGADEKICRVFEAPRSVAENLSTHIGLDVTEYLKTVNLPEGAGVPALGLSNRSIQDSDLSSDKQLDVNFTPLKLIDPPSESHLLQNTLWPEVNKLYGHENEIFSIAVSPDFKFLASACKATKLDHAVIIIWDTNNWHRLCNLVAHTLTVTQMAFSHSGKYLLSVSRDRTWAVFKKDDELPRFSSIIRTDKKTAKHTRIIWSCSWSHDDCFFITTSRDKKAIVWSIEDCATKATFTAESHLLLSDSITAVDFAPRFVAAGTYVVALGLDNGEIHVFTWTLSTKSFNEVYVLDKNTGHHATVNRLHFRPPITLTSNSEMKTAPGTHTCRPDDFTDEVCASKPGCELLTLASCSKDGIVKLFYFNVLALQV